MEGGQESQISVKYQIYCLFYYSRSCLEFRPCFHIWRQIHMEKLKASERAFPYHLRKKIFFLFLRLHRMFYSNII